MFPLDGDDVTTRGPELYGRLGSSVTSIAVPPLLRSQHGVGPSVLPRLQGHRGAPTGGRPEARTTQPGDRECEGVSGRAGPNVGGTTQTIPPPPTHNITSGGRTRYGGVPRPISTDPASPEEQRRHQNLPSGRTHTPVPLPAPERDYRSQKQPGRGVTQGSMSVSKVGGDLEAEEI